jgi:hypothetical protein
MRLSAEEGVYGSCDISEHVPNRLLAIDVKKYSPAVVKAEERLGLSLEHLETVLDRYLTVVRSPF